MPTINEIIERLFDLLDYYDSIGVMTSDEEKNIQKMKQAFYIQLNEEEKEN